MPPAEFSPDGYSVWLQSGSTGPWRADPVAGCTSNAQNGFCSTAALLAAQITSNYSANPAQVCVLQAAAISGDAANTNLPFSLDVTNEGAPRIVGFAGTAVNYGAPATQSYRVSITIKILSQQNSGCGALGTTQVLTWPIAKRRLFICPENWRANLLSDATNYQTYCIASNSGRGPIRTNVRIGDELANIPIPPPLGDKAILGAPPRDPDTCPKEGNPCQLATGKKTEEVTDFSYAGIVFQRFYDSIRDNADYGNLGPAWSHTFSARVMTGHLTDNHGGSSSSRVYYQSERGSIEIFRASQTTGMLFSVNEKGDAFKIDNSGPNQEIVYTLVKANGNRVRFNSLGYPVTFEYPASPAQNLTVRWTPHLALVGGPNFTTAEYVARRVYDVVNAQGRGLFFEYTTSGRDRLRRVRADTATGQILATYHYEGESIWPEAQLTEAHAYGNLSKASVSGLDITYYYNLNQ